ncbi:hypothetical protein HK096_009400, partial [Nowakowskiella sp. JEL0078]
MSPISSFQIPDIPNLPNPPLDLPSLEQISLLVLRILLDIALGAIAPAVVLFALFSLLVFAAAGIIAGSVAAGLQEANYGKQSLASFVRSVVALGALVFSHPLVAFVVFGVSSILGVVVDFTGFFPMLVLFAYCMGSGVLFFVLWVVSVVVMIFAMSLIVGVLGWCTMCTSTSSRGGYESIDIPIEYSYTKVFWIIS